MEIKQRWGCDLQVFERRNQVTRKIVCEVKLPKAVTMSIYAIAIALVLMVAKPISNANAAWALSYEDKIIVEHVTQGYFDLRMHQELYAYLGIKYRSVSCCCFKGFTASDANSSIHN